MTLSRIKLMPVLLLAASLPALSVDKGGSKFNVPQIESLPSKQTVQDVTVAVEAYTSETQSKAAFGKLHPYEHGILPVLVLIRNNSKKTIRLEEMQPQYVSGGREKIEAIPASEVKYARSPERPNLNPGPIPGIRRSKKNPLAAEEIEMRAFTARMLPPGETAHGFVYFHTGHRNQSSFYLSGLKDAASGQALFYFEIPFN